MNGIASSIYHVAMEPGDATYARPGRVGCRTAAVAVLHAAFTSCSDLVYCSLLCKINAAAANITHC